MSKIIQDNISDEIDFTNETDSSEIIEATVIDDFPIKRIRNGKAYHENEKTSRRVLSKKEGTITPNGSFPNSINKALRLSLKTSFKLLPEKLPASREIKSCENETPVKTPLSCSDLHSDTIEGRLLSSLKKNPQDLPYLSRTKMLNVERWLERNEVEVVRTPPFANLSVTPVSTGRKKFLRNRKEGDKPEEKCFIDSDVEDVLRAVYGSDWLQKNIAARAKTEPKRGTATNRTPLRMPVKGKKASVCSFRRNLLKGSNGGEDEDGTNDMGCLDDSVISGIEMINLDESNTSLESITEEGQQREKQHLLKRSNSVGLKGKAIDWVDEGAKRKNRNAVVLERTKSQKKMEERKARVVGAPGSAGKIPRKTFLASLSVSTPTSRSHPDADYYKINFKSTKDELIKKLFKLYNGEVFEEKLPNDMSFSWNVKLRGTAGYCYNKRITKSTGEILRVSRIEFSTKIVDRADRLRDTMIHELCHAASWILNGTLDGHGAVWSDWAVKAARRFPELPEIRRCHNYDIIAKYIYRCTCCGYSIKRHSKSINIERKRCGHCFGTLELLFNKKRKGKTEAPEFDATRTLRTPNKFAIFVKENYRSVKSLHANVKHAEIMKILGERYAVAKAENDNN